MKAGLVGVDVGGDVSIGVHAVGRPLVLLFLSDAAPADTPNSAVCAWEPEKE